MSRRSTIVSATFLTILALGLPGASIAEEIWTVHEGNTVVSLDLGLLRQLGLQVTSPGNPGNTDDRSRLTFSIDTDSTLTFSVERGSIVEFLGGWALHQDGLSLASRRGNIPIDNLIITQVRGVAARPFWAIEGPTGGTDGLVFDRAKAGFDTSLRTLTNPTLKGLLRRVVGKIFPRTLIEGYCSEFEARNAPDREARTQTAG